MIPIKHPNMEQLVLAHFKKIEQELTNEGQMENLLFVVEPYSLKDIICSNVEELKAIKGTIGEKKNELTFMLGFYKNFASRKGKEKYSAIEFVENLGITVCPYCNRAYIQTAKRDNNKAFRTCQLDHFFPKDKYPYLALSFFNLVPSCYACNHIKSDEDENLLSPYQSFKTDDLVKFGWNPLDSSYKYPKGKIGITTTLPEENGLSLEKNFEVFGLKNLYEKHKDVVQEILIKGEIYSNEYIKGLVAQFPDLIASEEEAMRLITGNYVTDEDLGKRPLAKLTRDIVKETKLIRK
jgi:hypothetical protein